MNSVFISIKPEYTKLIENQEKNYEFRNYLIKDIKYMYVYESISSTLKYIIEIGDIIEFPNQIDEEHSGNVDFNKGNFYKYAYSIKHLYKLKRPIGLMELKSKYGFTAPQKYTYINKYPKLEKELEKLEKMQIF